jgi:phosphatidate cytidylyltransferase
VLLGLLTLLPGSKSRVQGLWPLMGSEAVILAIGTLPWLLPFPVLGAALICAALRIGYESGVVNGMPEVNASGVLGAGILAVISALIWVRGDDLPLSWVAALIIGLACAAVLAKWLAKVWLWRFLIYPALPFALFVFFTHKLDAAFVLLLSFLLVEIFDSFSLLGGRLFGKRLLVPKLSPKKTWEGLLTGLLAVVISATALAVILEVNLAMMMVLALVSTAGALAGDLVASYAKRRAGVKDYPAVLPIQGGLLDIMDAWIVAGPLACLAYGVLH